LFDLVTGVAGCQLTVLCALILLPSTWGTTWLTLAQDWF